MNLNLPSATLLPPQLFFSWVFLGVLVSVGAVLLSRYAYNSNRNYLGLFSAAMLIAYFAATLIGFNHIAGAREDKTIGAAGALVQQVQDRYGLVLSDAQARNLVLGRNAQVAEQGELVLYKTGGVYELVHADSKTELRVR
jgi:hypothetical protein